MPSRDWFHFARKYFLRPVKFSSFLFVVGAVILLLEVNPKFIVEWQLKSKISTRFGPIKDIECSLPGVFHFALGNSEIDCLVEFEDSLHPEAFSDFRYALPLSNKIPSSLKGSNAYKAFQSEACQNAGLFEGYLLDSEVDEQSSDQAETRAVHIYHGRRANWGMIATPLWRIGSDRKYYLEFMVRTRDVHFRKMCFRFFSSGYSLG